MSIKPPMDVWKIPDDDQKECITRGFKCLLSPNKKIIEEHVTVKPGSYSHFRIWEDTEGNQMGEFWGTRFVRV